MDSEWDILWAESRSPKACTHVVVHPSTAKPRTGQGSGARTSSRHPAAFALPLPLELPHSGGGLHGAIVKGAEPQVAGHVRAAVVAVEVVVVELVGEVAEAAPGLFLHQEIREPGVRGDRPEKLVVGVKQDWSWSLRPAVEGLMALAQIHSGVATPSTFPPAAPHS